MSEFRNEIQSKLVGLISDDSLRTVIQVLDAVEHKYEINKKCTDLVVQSNEMPMEVKYYLADMVVRNLAKGSIRNSKNVLKLFFEAINYRKPSEITTNEIRGYLYAYQQESKASARYVDKVRQWLNSFFSWCVENEYLIKNPMAQIKKQKFEVKPRTALTTMELEQVRSVVTKPRDVAMLEFMYSTGCRVSEMSILKLCDVDFQSGKVTLFGKGRKYRTAMMSDRCIIAVKEYLSTRKGTSEYLFSNQVNTSKNVSRSQIEEIVKNWGEMADIKKHLTPHIIRHTFATHCLNRNVPVTSIQKALGHSNVATTMIYAEVNQDDVFNQIGKAIQ